MGWVTDKWDLSKNPFSIRELQSKEELNSLFVDREDEIRQLVNGLDSSEGGVVFGISGLRGSGKSSILNKTLEELKDRDSLVFNIKASGNFSEVEFLEKVLTDICDQINVKKATANLKKEVARLKTNLFYNEKISEEKASEASVKASIKANFYSLIGAELGSEIKEGLKTHIEKELKPYSKASLTREILQFLSLLKQESKVKHVIIGIDETDKCRFEDAERLLDSIKAVLNTNDCHFLFVGTLDFYKNFSLAFCNREEEATLASIFESVIKVRPFDKEKITSIIAKRLEYYSTNRNKIIKPFSDESLEVIAEMAQGNPKQLMRLCFDAFNYFGDKGNKIQANEVVQYFVNNEYILAPNSTEKIYLKVVNSLGNISAVSQTLFDSLGQQRIVHKDKKQYRVNLENLFSKNLVKKGVDESGQVAYSPSTLGKYVIEYID